MSLWFPSCHRDSVFAALWETVAFQPSALWNSKTTSRALNICSAKTFRLWLLVGSSGGEQGRVITLSCLQHPVWKVLAVFWVMHTLSPLQGLSSTIQKVSLPTLLFLAARIAAIRAHKKEEVSCPHQCACTHTALLTNTHTTCSTFTTHKHIALLSNRQRTRVHPEGFPLLPLFMFTASGVWH